MFKKSFVLPLILTAFLFAASACSSSGSNNNNVTKCENGTFRCADDMTVEVCTQETWGNPKTCLTGQHCENGKCVNPAFEEEGGDVDKEKETIFVIPDGDDEPEEEEEIDRGCVADNDCGAVSDYYCDRSTGYGICHRRLQLCDACKADLECGYDYDLCIFDPTDDTKQRKVCGLYCMDQSECPTGFTCVDTQCMLQKDALNGTACCVNAHCTDPKKPACNPVTHRCGVGCKTDNDCAQQFVCVQGVCKEGCAKSADCPAGTMCDSLTRICVEGECGSKADCPMETICDTGTRKCIPGCEDNLDCTAAKECKQAETGKICVERTGCRKDMGTGDCKLGMFCDHNMPDANNPDRGTCRTQEKEGGGYSCCGCSEDKECNYNGTDGYCVEIDFTKDEQGNVIPGKVKYKSCLVPVDCKHRNKDTGEFEGTLDCPRGFTCGELQIQSNSGTSSKWICVMDCNNFCKVPYLELINACGKITPALQSVCPLPAAK